MSINNINDLDAIKTLIKNIEKKQYFMGYNSGYRQALLDIRLALKPTEEEWEKAKSQSYAEYWNETKTEELTEEEKSSIGELLHEYLSEKEE